MSAQNFFKIRNGINLASLSSDPSSGSAGDFYYSTSTNTIRFNNGTQWLSVGAAGGVGQVQYIEKILTALPSAAPYTPDGIAVATGDIVLFTNLSSNNNRAYQATVSGGSVTWVVQSLGQNPSGAPHIGDLFYVEMGLLNANQILNYNGNSWVTFPAFQTVASKNYMRNMNPNFATGTIFPWTGASTTLTSNIPTTAPAPVTFGGTNINFAANSGVPLSANSSNFNGLLTTPSGSGVQGQMLLSGKMTVDRSDTAKVLNGSFSYEATSGLFSATGALTTSSIAIWIYNVNAAAWIQPAGSTGLTQGTGPGKVSFSFQTDGILANNVYQVALILNTTSTSTFQLTLNDFQLGPSIVQSGPIVTDWKQYTPTFNGFGSASGTFYSRRVGDTLEVFGAFSPNVPTAAEARISIGFNGSNNNVIIDVGNKLPGASLVGDAAVSSSGTTSFRWGIQGPTTPQSYVTMNEQTSTSGITVSGLGNAISATGNTIEVNFRVPIVGWSSNVQFSSDTDTRVVAASGAANNGTSVPTSTFTPIIWNTGVQDTHGALNQTTGTYTIPVSGWYKFDGVLIWALASWSSSVSAQVQLFINGGSVRGLSALTITATATQNITNNFSYSSFFTAGTTINIEAFQNGGTTQSISGNSFISISRLSGPSQIAASESVNMRATSATTAIGTSSAVVVFPNKLFDSHGGYNASTGVYTVPISGKYRVTSMIYAPATISSSSASASNNIFHSVTKNGVNDGLLSNWILPVVVSGETAALNGSCIHMCNAGDTLQINAGRGTSIGAFSLSGDINTYFCIERIGN